MELAKIDVAPKNGDFIILQDACSREVGRWAQEANGWVQPDGTPVRISPTHWTRVSDDFAGPTDRERLLFLDALAAPLPDDETEQTQKRPLNRLILALVTAIFCIGGFVFWMDPKIQALIVRQPTWNENSLESEIEPPSLSAVSLPLGSAEMLR